MEFKKCCQIMFQIYCSSYLKLLCVGCKIPELRASSFNHSPLVCSNLDTHNSKILGSKLYMFTVQTLPLDTLPLFYTYLVVLFILKELPKFNQIELVEDKT